MSRENVEVVRDALAGARDGRFFEVADHDIEYDATSSPGPFAGVYCGHDGLREFFRNWIGSWQDYEVEIDELIDAGEAVVAVIRERGRGKESGAPVENRVALVWTLRNGKATHIRRYSCRSEALEAVGLRE